LKSFFKTPKEPGINLKEESKSDGSQSGRKQDNQGNGEGCSVQSAKKPLPANKNKKRKGIARFFKAPKEPGNFMKENVKIVKEGLKPKTKAKGRLQTMFAQVAERKVSMLACPSCQKQIPESKINRHLDTCLR